MPVNITLKNIPEPLYRRLKLSAEANRRSINMEAITLLEEAFAPKPVVSVEERIARAQAFRKSLAHIPITDDDINAFKNEGRE